MDENYRHLLNKKGRTREVAYGLKKPPMGQNAHIGQQTYTGALNKLTTDTKYQYILKYKKMRKCVTKPATRTAHHLSWAASTVLLGPGFGTHMDAPGDRGNARGAQGADQKKYKRAKHPIGR
eukprot:GEMP01049601.1.p2 GENE.GEMP01049601.1~~GEMP01049601.1.p2  ORF type:complete len:122 (-),score=17.44 GEMP01049601.1:370-735(-)